jgi:hypothetical protein
VNSFLFQDRNHIIMNTEDFSDEIDEHEDESGSHRMSIVKRYNINTSIFSPGSRIVQSSIDAVKYNVGAAY